MIRPRAVATRNIWTPIARIFRKTSASMPQDCAICASGVLISVHIHDLYKERLQYIWLIRDTRYYHSKSQQIRVFSASDNAQYHFRCSRHHLSGRANVKLYSQNLEQEANSVMLARKEISALRNVISQIFFSVIILFWMQWWSEDGSLPHKLTSTAWIQHQESLEAKSKLFLGAAK